MQHNKILCVVSSILSSVGFSNFWVNKSFLWGHWYYFGLLTTSVLVLKVACFVTCMQWILQIHLWSNRCWTVGSQHDRHTYFTLLFHALIWQHLYCQNNFHIQLIKPNRITLTDYFYLTDGIYIISLTDDEFDQIGFLFNVHVHSTMGR